MFSGEQVLQKLESFPSLFSLVHRYGGGADINRRAFTNLIRPGATVVEVGANKGSYTTLLSRLAGNGGKIYAFEPVSETFERLTARLESLRVTNVSAFKVAVSDGSRHEAEIIIPGDDSQQASLVAHRAGSWSAGEQRREPIKMTSLDAFLANHNVDQVDFVKLDVEGAELNVLRGGVECLRRSKPALHVELNSEWLDDFGTNTAELLQFFRSHGYQFVYKIDGASIRGFSKANPTDMEKLRAGHLSGDFLFSSGAL